MRVHRLSSSCRDLAANWDVDLANELEDYIAEIEKITYSFEGLNNLNFAEGQWAFLGEKERRSFFFLNPTVVFCDCFLLFLSPSRSADPGLCLRVQPQGRVLVQLGLPDPRAGVLKEVRGCCCHLHSSSLCYSHTPLCSLPEIPSSLLLTTMVLTRTL